MGTTLLDIPYPVAPFVGTTFISILLEPFSVQMHEVRRVVQEVAGLFGRNNFFSEYTVHDYRHIHSMLKSLEWIIPDSTKGMMSNADWILIVLSIYFHDLGLIITEEEFLGRDATDFIMFRDENLFKGIDGKDYRAKIEILGAERAERFFYQEFVRHNHGARVRAWIEGSANKFLGDAVKQTSEIYGLISRMKLSLAIRI